MRHLLPGFSVTAPIHRSTPWAFTTRVFRYSAHPSEHPMGVYYQGFPLQRPSIGAPHGRLLEAISICYHYLEKYFAPIFI